jgi:hypothetical protein
MRFRILAFLISALALVPYSANAEGADTAQSCQAKLFSPAVFDPKNLEQCVKACIACDRGSKATCTTSCTLKGAH